VRLSSPLWARLVALHAEGELRFAVAGTIGNWLGAFGQRVGMPALVRNPLRFADWHHRSLETAPVAVDGLLLVCPAIRDAIDLGCGTGIYVYELRKRGVRAVGYERSAYARHVARHALGLDVRPFDIGRFDGAQGVADVCLCLEVAHYLTFERSEQLLGHCARAARLVVFSAPRPRQGPATTIGARQYWIDRFEVQGMQFCARDTATVERYLRTHLTRNHWLADNISVFIR
jgi:SAM-dependent methyltransferase